MNDSVFSLQKAPKPALIGRNHPTKSAKREDKMKTFKIIFVASVIVVQFTNANAQTFLKNGLVAYYPFKGNANDESGNGHNGTVFGATLVTDRFGNSNSAYYFNGNSWIDIGKVVTRYDTISLSAWIRTTTPPSPEEGIVCKPSTTTIPSLSTWMPIKSCKAAPA